MENNKYKEIKRMLVVDQAGEKQIIEVDYSGDYAFKDKIIWDERTQGDFTPEILAMIDADKVAQADKEKKRADAVKNAMDNLKELDLKSDLSAKDLQKAIKALVRITKNAE